MKVEITNPAIEAFVAEQIRAGRYESAEALINAAVAHLKANRDQEADAFLPGELDRLIAEGDASGEPLEAEAVFAELRQLREQAAAKQ